MANVNRWETKVDGVDVVLVKEPRLRTFGGWYQQTIVLVGEKEIGRVQIRRRRNGRTDAITILKTTGESVMRNDLRWLVEHVLG